MAPLASKIGRTITPEAIRPALAAAMCPKQLNTKLFRCASALSLFAYRLPARQLFCCPARPLRLGARRMP